MADPDLPFRIEQWDAGDRRVERLIAGRKPQRIEMRGCGRPPPSVSPAGVPRAANETENLAVRHLERAADPAVAVVPHVRSAVYASLLARLDMLKSLGLVWSPGVMAGMMVFGREPGLCRHLSVRHRPPLRS